MGHMTPELRLRQTIPAVTDWAHTSPKYAQILSVGNTVAKALYERRQSGNPSMVVHVRADLDNLVVQALQDLGYNVQSTYPADGHWYIIQPAFPKE